MSTGEYLRLIRADKDARESTANAGMCNSFWILQLLGKSVEKPQYCRVSMKRLEAWRKQQSVCFFH